MIPHPGQKNFASILEMTVFRKTVMYIVFSTHKEESFHLQGILIDCNVDTITVNSLLDGVIPLADLTGKLVGVRIPCLSGVIRFTATIISTGLSTENGSQNFVITIPGDFEFTNHRHKNRISIPRYGSSLKTYFKECTGRKITFNSASLIDISESSAAIRTGRSAPPELQMNSVDTLQVKRSGKTVFQVAISGCRTIPYEEKNVEVQRHILFFKPIVSQVPHIRRIRRVIPSSGLQVFIETNHPLVPEYRLRGRMVNFSKTGLAFIISDPEIPVFSGMQLDPFEISIPFSRSLITAVRVVHCTAVPNRGELQIGVQLLRLSDMLNLETSIFYLQNLDTTLVTAQSEDFDKILYHLFLSRFIYHQKREFLQGFSERVLETQIRLLGKNNISKTIISKKNGEIGGIVQYLKYHDHAWLVQHLAGGARYTPEIGKMLVMATIDFFLSPEVNQFLGIDYVLCFYRPENPYPMILFDGFAQQTDDFTISGVFDYAYCTVNLKKPMPQVPEKRDFVCDEASDTDLEQFERYIDNVYGIIYKKVEALAKATIKYGKIIDDYARSGLVRDRRIFCLKSNKNIPIAYAVCERSSPGVNLSELTNSFKVYYPHGVHACPTDARNLLLYTTLAYYHNHGVAVPILLVSGKETIPEPFMEKKRYRFWYIDAAHFSALQSYCLEIAADFKTHLRKFRQGGYGNY